MPLDWDGNPFLQTTFPPLSLLLSLIGSLQGLYQAQEITSVETPMPRLTSAWDTFGLIADVVTKFCKADPGEIQPTAFRSRKSNFASS